MGRGTMAIRRDKVEQRLARIERLAREQLDQVAQLREELGKGESSDEMWARMIHHVLSEVDRRGGSVAPQELLDVGHAVGYERQGMAGFYQKLLTQREGVTYLTDEGRTRLHALNERFKATV